MKARIVKKSSQSICLILSCGKIKYLSPDEAKEFLFAFDRNEHYIETSQTKYFLEHMDSYTGTTLAYVNDDGELVIPNPSFLQDIFGEAKVNYLTAAEYGEKHGKKDGIIKRMCRTGRIPGAITKGTQWLIPSDAPYPQDARVGTRVGNNL